MSKKLKKKQEKLLRSKHIYHAQKRVAQRFGLSTTPEDIVSIGRLIRKGQSTCIGVQSKTRTHHLVTYREKEMVVVYDKKHKIPITILYARGSDLANVKR